MMRSTIVRLTLLTMAVAMCDASHVYRPEETNTMEGSGNRKANSQQRTTSRHNRRAQYIMKTSIAIAPEGRKKNIIKRESPDSQYYGIPPSNELREEEPVALNAVDPVSTLNNVGTVASTDPIPELHLPEHDYADMPSPLQSATEPGEGMDVPLPVFNETDSDMPTITITSKKPYYYKHRSKKQDNMMQKIDRDEAMHGSIGKGSGYAKGEPKKSSKKSRSTSSGGSMKESSKKSSYSSGKGSKGTTTSKGKGNGPVSKGQGPSTPRPSLPTWSPSPVGSPTTAMPTLAVCNSEVADQILDAVPEVITKNPNRCCVESGPTAVFVTHALYDNSTSSGFEPFWDTMYATVLELANRVNVCFVMTGVRADVDAASLPGVLINVLTAVSSLSAVPAMLSTDPTADVTLLQTVRSISNNQQQPSIGLFNAGYDNIIIEAIVTGQERLPYIGHLNEAEYGKAAGKVTLELLAGMPARPLCFNARVGQVNFIEERCAAYYTEVTDTAVVPEGGVACSSQSNPNDILQQLLSTNANAVWSHIDCCSAVAEAVGMAEVMGRSIVIGCQDADTTEGQIDFVTEQPSQLQAYHATAWVSYPVIQDLQGKDGRGEMYFPALQSLVNTAVYNVILA